MVLCHVPEAKKSTHAPEFKVYVYDEDLLGRRTAFEEVPQLKPLLRSQIYCSRGQWGTDVQVHDYFFASDLQTDDPDEADFFFVPGYAICVLEGNLYSLDEVDELYKDLVTALPYFNASGGRDHIFVFGSGMAQSVFQSWEEYIPQSIVLTPETELFNDFAWVAIPPYRPFKDIVIPGSLDLIEVIAALEKSKPLHERRFLSAFFGRADVARGPHPWVGGVDVRKELLALRELPGTEDMKFGDGATLEVMHEAYGDAKFCFVPRGKSGWSLRFFEVIFAGCIPVMISDKWELPFEDFLDVTRFVIKWPSTQIGPQLIAYLRSLPDSTVQEYMDEAKKIRCWYFYPPKKLDVRSHLQRQHGVCPEGMGQDAFRGIRRILRRRRRKSRTSTKAFYFKDATGFFLQPATGFGERSFDEASWHRLLQLSRYPQVHVKISALFRVAEDPPPFPSLSKRLKELLNVFGSQRLLWGSDFPYATEHSSYAEAVHALEAWPIWEEMSKEDRQNILYATTARLYGLLATEDRELLRRDVGRIDMGGWQTIAAKSSPEVIVWMLDGDPSTTCNWLLEEDADQENTLEGLDSRNIIEGKRRRNKVDYVALEKQLDEEERQHQDVFSDDSSSSAGTGKIQKIKKPHREDSTEMTPKEWSEHHAAQCKKAAHLFRKWMLGTSTPRHEEILRRKSKLQVRFPVSLIGPGRRMLEQELSPYGVTLRFHQQEVVAVVDAACRQRFKERHAHEWRDVSERLAKQTPAAPANAAVPAEVANAASTMKTADADGAPEGSSQPREKKRRLRRVVTSDDEAEPQEPSKPAEAPEPVPREGAAPASAAPPTGEALEGPLEGEDLSEIIEKAKKKLETSPAPQEVSRLLTHLESQSMNAQLLVTTKIGLAVNGLRKSYAKYPNVVQQAVGLVNRWKELWMQEKAANSA
ncbi:Probable glucuronoxylan glucuronosyltransferase F8H (FRA8 homolog) (Protein FRAGILE FIBER 8 homolog) [Durusdinium trenchii]|uniref:Probable glucuronoxylan glucuronosyltransferase F8H (FRA8 homolog) (Protein FRAGILE FIBER 8 homolog) n=2 Tax=Durusdinium trenchii TaxID=1381693 RepID=A0ABP0L0J2_9DINO